MSMGIECTPTDTILVIRCPHCVMGIEFRPMIAYKDGRFVCRDCAHTVRPGVPEYRCSCRSCLTLTREPSQTSNFLP
jgi:late competence protein required for DNA uptake (superfamily II DNA/RNA helicase)